MPVSVNAAATGNQGVVSGAGKLPVSGGVQWASRTALQAVALAATRRVDLVMIGDSNQGYNAYGFSQGIAKYLSGLYGLYATPLMTASMVAQYGAAGVDSSGAAATGAAATPAALWSASATAQGVVTGYRHLATGTSNGVGGINVDSRFPVQDALRAWFATGNSSTYASGSFRPGVRLSGSPFTSLATYATTISTTADFDGLSIVSVDVAADGTRASNGIEARNAVPGGTTCTGPFTWFYTRVERPAVTTGISCHTLYYAGGQSAWNMANDIGATTDKTLTTFFAEVRRLQIAAGFDPVVIIYVNSGLNDRNEANSPSLGPAQVVGGTSAAAFADNHRAIQARIYDVWRRAGWNLNELYWLFVPSHRIADPDDAQLVSYRAALIAACAGDPQTSVVDLGARMTYAAANGAGWYAAGQNQLHLTNAGYDGVAALMFT